MNMLRNPNRGESGPTVRKPVFTGSELAKEAGEQFGLGRRFFRTVWHLIVKPGSMLRQCLSQGCGLSYLGPITFLLLTMSMWWFIWMRFPPPFLSDIASSAFLIDYGAMLSCLSILPLALGTRMILSNLDLTFVEHVVANAYVWSTATLIVIMAFPLVHTSLGFEILAAINVCVTFLYYPYAFSQLGERGFPKDFPRSWLAVTVGGSLMAIPLGVLISIFPG